MSLYSRSNNSPAFLKRGLGGVKQSRGVNILRLTLLILFFLPLTCFAEKTIRWKQEVQLSDGRVIIMQRVSEQNIISFPGIPHVEFKENLSFTNPDTAENIIWPSLPKGLQPFSLDFDKKVPYLVLAPYTVADYNDWNCPNPTYFLYRYRNKQWLPIPFSQLPAQFYKRNLIEALGFLSVSEDRFATLEEQDRWSLRLDAYLRTINREKTNPMAWGCRLDTLIKQGRESEINIPYYNDAGVLITPKTK